MMSLTGCSLADTLDRYSGVKRQDFPPLSNQSTNKYTPPARRAPTSHQTVPGAPVDPAIISSQLRAPRSKQSTPKPDEAKTTTPSTFKAPEPSKADTKPSESTKKEDSKPTENSDKATTEPKTAEKPSAALRASVTAGRTISPATKENTPIEKEVLDQFKEFAKLQRKKENEKLEAGKKKKMDELKNFSATFKLATPVPSDLIGIIAGKDPKKQQEIQAKALKNAEDVKRAKEEAKKDQDTKVLPSAKPSQAKPTEQAVATSSNTGAPSNTTEGRNAPRASGVPQHTNTSGPGPNRHPGNRQSYAPGAYQQSFRGDRSSTQNLSRHSQQGGHLAQRLRNGEQQKMSQSSHHMPPDVRVPPTGPANVMPPYFTPRHAGMPPSHMGPGPRLNPNTQEFRPNAQPFYPTGPSATSSPRSALNNIEAQGNATPTAAVVIRRKVKAIDVKKCFILSHVQSIKPPQAGNRAWEENGGLRPPFDTMPTWRQLREEEKDKVSYKQLFDRPPYTGAIATPNTAPVVPQMPHQHQLPFHLQQGAQNAGPRQSPHMPPMQMHTGQPVPHAPFNNGDDATRMMHSNSAQSYASPRPGQVPMAYPNMMNSPSHMPYSQPVMPGFMGPANPQMTPQMRNFAQAPQYMPQQPGQMGPPMMMGGPQYMTAPSPLMQGTPQMPMAYPGGPQFAPPGPVPPQAMQGTNGYPSPGRPAAPMMAHQGSQQGQHIYGMSPGTMPQFQQPVFAPQQPGQSKLNNRRYSSSGRQY